MSIHAMNVFIANNPEALADLDWTVEAEFGARIAEGTTGTLAHHGSRSQNPCPCLADNIPGDHRWITVGISHVDLDTVGGILAVAGDKPEFPGFWEAAAEVDVKGAHKLPSITQDPAVLDRLNAYWAFSECHRIFTPRGIDRSNVTTAVLEHCEAVIDILRGDAAHLEAGRLWAKTKELLDAESFVDEASGVILRKSVSFVNHLYRDAACVVAFNPDKKTVTVSLAEPITGLSCRQVVQDLWGPDAGGHDGIAGSPRGKEMCLGDSLIAFGRMATLLIHV